MSTFRRFTPYFSYLIALSFLVAGCGGGGATEPAGDAGGDATVGEAAEAVVEEAAETVADAAEQQAADEAADQAPDEAPAAEATEEMTEDATQAITEETLVGTKWTYQGMFEFEFQPEGKLLIDGGSEGTWSVDGQNLTIGSPDMGEYTATIEGDKITYDGIALDQL